MMKEKRKFNVTFEGNERVTAGGLEWIMESQGVDQFVAKNKDHILIFQSDAGKGRNYFKITGYYNAKTGRRYYSTRFFYKWISTVQEINFLLFDRWQKSNKTFYVYVSGVGLIEKER